MSETFDLRGRELLLRRTRLVASSLGACSCWGADPACPRCRGTGRKDDA